MSAPIKVNHYKSPYPNAAYANPGLLAYKQWNGWFSGPETVRLGATQIYNVASVPADLSTFILNTPDGRAVTFQFVYNASVQTQGIKIALPLSGASTAAQVNTAILAAMSVAVATAFGGVAVPLPFNAVQTGAAQFRIDWKVGGTTNVATGTQATITAGAVVQSTIGLAQAVPARCGKIGTFMRTA